MFEKRFLQMYSPLCGFLDRKEIYRKSKEYFARKLRKHAPVAGILYIEPAAGAFLRWRESRNP